MTATGVSSSRTWFRSFLLRRPKKQSSVVAAAVGLILYGVTTEEELLGVGQGEYAEFKRQADRRQVRCPGGHL